MNDDQEVMTNREDEKLNQNITPISFKKPTLAKRIAVLLIT